MSPRGRGVTIGAEGMAEGRHGNTVEQRAAAARTVASAAVDAEDCVDLLAMLGLTVQDGLSSSERAS